MNLSSAIQALDKKSKDAFAGLTNAFPEGSSQEDRLHYLTKQASCILLPVYLYVSFISFYLFSSITYHISSIYYLLFFISHLLSVLFYLYLLVYCQVVGHLLHQLVPHQRLPNHKRSFPTNLKIESFMQVTIAQDCIFTNVQVKKCRLKLLRYRLRW